MDPTCGSRLRAARSSQRLVEMYPPFRTYRTRTDRPFPIVMLYPTEAPTTAQGERPD